MANRCSCWTYKDNQAKLIESKLTLRNKVVLICLSLIEMRVILERKVLIENRIHTCGY